MGPEGHGILSKSKREDDMVKGLRSIRREVHPIIAAGRTLEQQVEDIRREGIIFTPAVLRNSIIGGLEIRKKKGTAENVVVIGCACFGTALPLRSFCLLLQRLGVDYVFLEKEYCCGAPLIHEVLFEGKERGTADAFAREFIGMNIAQARQKGARNMIYFCTWCAYLARRFFPQEEVRQLFYPDILVERLNGVKLKLDAVVGYFGGRAHRRPVYIPDEDVDLDWKAYRSLLDRVEGLKVIDIPRYCCQIAPQYIFQRAENAGLDTIVVSCIVCYGRLVRIAPPRIRIKFLSDILLEAMP